MDMSVDLEQLDGKEIKTLLSAARRVDGNAARMKDATLIRRIAEGSASMGYSDLDVKRLTPNLALALARPKPSLVYTVIAGPRCPSDKMDIS